MTQRRRPPKSESDLFEVRATRPARLHRCSWFLVSLILVHGMVISPLLVECIRADGLLLIEWIGHDPCRSPAPGQSISASRSFTSVLCAWAEDRDSCVDLSMDNAAVVQPGPDVRFTPVQLAPDWTGAASFCATDCALPGAGLFQEPPGEPVSSFDCSTDSSSRLRI